MIVTAAAMILLLFGVAMFALLSGPSSTEELAQQQPPPPIEPSAGTQVPRPPVVQGRPDRSHRTSQRRRQAASRSTEIATDFLPLTFVDDASDQESGHVVRVKVPRSALIAFGVPMNMERAGELITADVVIGGDGLARAIRFVQ
jgi:hypothetical protein